MFIINFLAGCCDRRSFSGDSRLTMASHDNSGDGRGSNNGDTSSSGGFNGQNSSLIGFNGDNPASGDFDGDNSPIDGSNAVSSGFNGENSPVAGSNAESSSPSTSNGDNSLSGGFHGENASPDGDSNGENSSAGGSDRDKSSPGGSKARTPVEISCPKSKQKIVEIVFNPTGEHSRFLTDFGEEMHLGSGGYGCVVRCRNKLDGQLYAVKKICLEMADLDFEHISREFKALAILSHPHIVRYYAAWVESEVAGVYKQDEYLEDEYLEDEYLEDAADDPDLTGPCLYIQQELCSSSLQQVLTNREVVDVEFGWKIFHQIVSAIDHMHSKRVQHGDLNCSNIFLDGSNEVKIGDFGLASLEGKEILGRNSPFSESHPYAAPELRRGKCGPSADIYSLGMIMFDLFHHFPTVAEKVAALDTLKDNFPDGSPLTPSQRLVLLDLVDESPDSRPAIHMILDENFWKKTDNTTEELMD